ncbi:MAG: hypothetical protein ACFFE1_14130 [Candidatus Thorarchaeota archaeon]
MSEDLEQTDSSEPMVSYEVLFVLGITLIGAGAALLVSNRSMGGLLVIGVILLAVSILNRDKWKPA